jgi:hypothetical protein
MTPAKIVTRPNEPLAFALPRPAPREQTDEGSE